MTLVIPDSGEVAMLQAVLALADSLHLYTNNRYPAAADVASDYSEAVGAGYGAESLTPGSWVITAGAPSEGLYPQVVFTFTGALGNVYGYYVTESDGSLLWAERFPNGPYQIANNGDDIKITLGFEFRSVVGD